MTPEDLRQLLAAGPVVADGGMGTSLADRGLAPDACFELANIEHPELVLDVHRAFVAGGARLILTNTWGANRFKVGDRVAELNHAGAALARQAGAELVAGSVGPLGVRLAPYGRVRPADAQAAYAEQIGALVEGGVHLLVIETQSDLAEARRALAAARAAADIAVIVTATFTGDDRTLLGNTPEQIATLEADAIGVNCSEGPAQAVRLIAAMRRAAPDAALVARPNAGRPERVGGRLLYPATPEYFGDEGRQLADAGAGVIGGCCGTTPEHVGALIDALRTTPRAAPPAIVIDTETPTAEAVPPTHLSQCIADRRFVVAVEMDPPRSFSAARLLAGAETLRDAGADVVNIADSPLARMRMSAWAPCRLIQEHVGIETVLHFPTRGRNLLRLQGDLLAAHALGIRNLFVCLGDPVTVGDYPEAANNVDIAPTGLIALVTQSFNRGTDQAGASIGEATRFVVGCAVNPGAPDLERECRLLRRKVEAGAHFALTPPLYTMEPLDRLRAASGEIEIPLLVGVLPLVSERHAAFLDNEVPGLSVPVEARRRAAGGEPEGVAMAVELATQLAAHTAGMYLMPPFGRYGMAAEVIEATRSAVARG